MQTISVKHKRGKQYLQAEFIARREDGVTFRAVIKRDSHDEQSHANVYAWTANGWSFVTETPFENTRMSAFSYVTKDEAWTAAFAMDANDLIDEAMNIVPLATPVINKLDTDVLNSLSEEIKNFFPKGISISSDMKFTRDQIATFVKYWKGAN